MGLLSLTSEELRYKMKHLGVLCPDRSVANDEQFYELYSKFKDVIEINCNKIRNIFASAFIISNRKIIVVSIDTKY